MSVPSLFLDRDGVINHEKHYLYKISDFEFIDGVIPALQSFSNQDYAIFIITNQSGIARGIYTEQDYHILTEWLLQQFQHFHIHIQKIYYCPHHPSVNGYCPCRKPEPGMILQAAREFQLTLDKAILVGDKNSDIEAGIRAGIQHNYLIQTGHAITQNPHQVPIIRNLLDLLV